MPYQTAGNISLLFSGHENFANYYRELNIESEVIMKTVFFILLLVSPFSSFAQAAKIKIDVDRTIGKIDPKIYGVFMEPIHFSRPLPGQEEIVSGNTLYGPLYNPESPLADENGFNKAYIEAAKELGITNMRWPGGNYTAGYNWQDGIGPKEKRPVRKELAWNR